MQNGMSEVIDLTPTHRDESRIRIVGCKYSDIIFFLFFLLISFLILLLSSVFMFHSFFRALFSLEQTANEFFFFKFHKKFRTTFYSNH